MELRSVIFHEFFAGVRLQPVINPINAIESCVFVFTFFCLCNLAETLFQRMESSFQVGWKSLRQFILLGSSCWKSPQQARGDSQIVLMTQEPGVNVKRGIAQRNWRCNFCQATAWMKPSVD